MQVCYEFADPKQDHMREKTGRTVYLNSIREKASIKKKIWNPGTFVKHGNINYLPWTHA